MKFKVDEWVLYCQFPDITSLKNNKQRSVILDVLPKESIYDYKIYIDDGTGTIKKVKEENLEYADTKMA
tara:strand:- start:318 stop:524 length:207 start_codon:yes stop_codon:yes gene_type:complete